MIERLVRALQAAGVELESRELADALWLAEGRREAAREHAPPGTPVFRRLCCFRGSVEG